ncbi:hypothetical protein ES708_34888 [subsurface metagenome]
MVTAVAEGEATITVSYADMTDTVAVTVSAVKLDHIVVLPEKMTLYLGGVDSKTITSITAHYNDGTEAEKDLATCDYGLSKVGIVDVDDTGLVTVIALGETTIIVSYEEEGITKTDTIEVTVDPVIVTSIVVTPDVTMVFGAAITVKVVGLEWEIITFSVSPESCTIDSVTAYYNNETYTYMEDLEDCIFSSKPTGIVVVSDAGVVTLPYVEGGKLPIKDLVFTHEPIITVEYGGKTATIKVEVTETVTVQP